MELKKLFTGILVIFVFSFNVYSQIPIQNSNQGNSQLNSQQNTNLKVNADAPDLLNQFNSNYNSTHGFKQFAIDKTVDPGTYIVGPNDIFSLGLYGFMNQQIPLIVNVEGSLIIPTVGEIKVDGLTLSKVKENVISAVKKRYYSSDVSLNLTTPRTFLISISGAVQKKLEVTSLTRTSDIINQVVYDTLSPTVKNVYPEFFVPDYSLRNIEITRKNGKVEKVDLYKYFYTNDDKYNPYFQNGDLLKIPYGQLKQNYISVNGAVQLGGVYEYNSEDDLFSVINLARGFDNDANTDSITIFRYDYTNAKYEQMHVNFDKDKDFKINVFDRVFVKYKSSAVLNHSVTVLGEVAWPGVYPISFKKTTLKEIIELAGGFLPTAYLPLSIVFRRNDEEYTRKDTAEILINMRANDLLINEKDKQNFERDVISRRNRVVVDFEKLYNENDSSQNIILENKDVIYINDNKNIVYVYGQVGNEGYVPYKEGEDYEYYIKKSGGYSLAADKGNTRIIKFNSRGWYEADNSIIRPGDFIYVPKETPAEFKESLTIIATMIGVVASVITTYLLIIQQDK